MTENRMTTEKDAVHAILLEMLDDIGLLCEKHGIRYSLYCGTLLGAVREGGLIPWDDDADLTMPADDCRRFFDLAQRELADKYVVQDLQNTPSHPWLWVRVFRKGTTYLRNDWRDLKVHHGIAVDIYPMIGAADGRLPFRIQKAVLDLAKALRHIDYWKVTGYPENRFQSCVGRMLSLIPGYLRRKGSIWLLHAAELPPYRTKKICTLDGAEFVPKYDRRDWRHLTKMSLNGRSFPVPAEYDRLLRIMYGDYMTPPPAYMREDHGTAYGGAVIDTKKDYTVYLDSRTGKDKRKTG